MSDGVIDQIKQKLDILEVLGEYIRMSKAGRNYKARCPFHAERSASFMVSPERQIWHCFGCGLGGDIFGFIMKMEGIEFGDALRLLARRAGITLKKQDPQQQSQKKRLYEVCELAAKFFEVQLEKTIEGKNGLKYLLERGLKSETIKEWRIGFSHDKWRALHDFLKSRGYKAEEMLQAGLIIEKNQETGARNQEKYYDRFRSRIMFPIFDSQGQVIAFGGRIFGEAAKKDDVAKYVNSPQGPLYDKSAVLFGLNKAKNEIRTKDQCLIVEGYMDLIMSHQSGVANVVASSGTALTDTQLGIINRYTKNLVMAFDSDEAGSLATRRSIDLALNKDFNVKVILMKDKDPADIVKKSPEAWLKLVADAQDIMDFYFSYAFEKFDGKTAEGRKKISQLILPTIKSLAGITEQSEWLQELARRLRVDERDLAADLKKINIVREAPANNISFTPSNLQKTRQEGIEERLLGLCLAFPKYFNDSLVCGDDFSNQDLKAIFDDFKKLIEKEPAENITQKLIKKLEPSQKIKIDYLLMQIERDEQEEDEIEKELKDCARNLRDTRLKAKLGDLAFEIRDAQAAGNQEKMSSLLKQFKILSEELNR